MHRPVAVPTDAADLVAPAGLTAEPLERIPAPSVEEFRRGYVVRRHPVVLRGLSGDWPASRQWSLDYLRCTFGRTPVTTIRAQGGRVIMDAKGGAIEEVVRLADFIDSVHAGARDRYMTTSLKGLPESLRRDAPTPAYCAQASWKNGNLWIGPAGTIARLHRDLADNIHVLVRGRKRVTLVSPRQSALVYPNGVLERFPNGCRVDIERPDFVGFPRLREVRSLVTELEPGDAVYIPRGWWHHVRTLETAISVNFWWARGVRKGIVLATDLFKRLRGISR
jgi:hypothetical protein